MSRTVKQSVRCDVSANTGQNKSSDKSHASSATTGWESATEASLALRQHNLQALPSLPLILRHDVWKCAESIGDG